METEETFALSAVNSLQEAVNTILKLLGLAPNNQSERVADGTHTHTLCCSGKFGQPAHRVIRHNRPFVESTICAHESPAAIRLT